MRHSSEQRRLFAVLVADIVGYSRLMAENEADTFYRLKDFQTSLITPAVQRNYGSVVKWTGDGFVAIFDSAVDSVRAAVEIQSGVAAAGVSTEDARRIRFRIGINSGDVITVPGDVYGDTVNIAARLQTLAEPGGICISRSVRDTVRGKFSVEFEDRGELAVKNIPDPVGTFNVVFDPIAWTMSREAAPPTAWLTRTAYFVAVAILLLVGAVGGVGWYFLRYLPSQPTTTAGLLRPVATSSATIAAPLREEVSARLAAAVPAIAVAAREKAARDYEAAPAHKAQAASLQPPGFWRAFDRPTADNAEVSALENCQIFFGLPCVLIAVDGVVQPLSPGAEWPRRDMSRVRYAGSFDPAQIPGSSPATRERSDIVNFRAATAYKAASIHPAGGRIFTISGAASQRAAEGEVLKACNTDPTRNGEGGPCFLYAVGDRVVLPLRLVAPLTEASAPTAAASPSGSPPRETLSARLAAALPSFSTKAVEEAARNYDAARAHKAQAVSLEPLGLWRTGGRADAKSAETAALEQCQVAYGQPCVLLAVDDAIQAVPPDRDWPHRDMSRARYADHFDPGQIPGATPATRARPDVANYRMMAAPKAAAFHPNGSRIFTVAGAASQRSAEEEALQACNSGAIGNGAGDQCFLYAVGDQVMLPRRLREPLTAASAR
jgi:class 3 adenylate cyclase